MRGECLTKQILLPLLGLALVSCTNTGGPSYEAISSKTVSGVTLEMVRRSQLDSEGNPAGNTDYGILDPSGTFYGCGNSPCSDSDFERVAAVASADREPGGGGGGGGGGM